MEKHEVMDTAESIAAALRLLEHSAAERGGTLALPIEAEVAVLRLARQAAERIATATNETIAERSGTLYRLRVQHWLPSALLFSTGRLRVRGMAGTTQFWEPFAMTTLHARESRVRRALAKQGMRLQKTPSRSWLRHHYGPGYQVVDDRNCVITGCTHHEFQATIEEVEHFTFGPTTTDS